MHGTIGIKISQVLGKGLIGIKMVTLMQCIVNMITNVIGADARMIYRYITLTEKARMFPKQNGIIKLKIWNFCVRSVTVDFTVVFRSGRVIMIVV